MPGRWLNKLGEVITCLFERHKFVRRSALFILFALLVGAHLVIYGVIWRSGEVTTAVVAIFTQTLALTGVITAWYMQIRRHEDQ